MSFSIERESPDFARRYDAIEQANARSFYMTDPNRSFDAYQSVQSFGPSRTDEALAAERVLAAGNMSPLGPYGPSKLSEEERITDAKDNMDTFFKDLGIEKTSVYLLSPERDYSTPLSVVDVDAQEVSDETEWPVRLSHSGDFIYSYDSKKVLGARPADCPVMFATADTPKGKIHMLVHYAWQGAANHYVQQTSDVFDTLDIDRSTLEIYLTPGAQAESFPYGNKEDFTQKYPGTEGLFVNTEEHINDAGEKNYTFNIDTPKFVYDQVLTHFGVTPEQVFCDTSDTSALESGYSSHGRSKRLDVDNTRDIVVGVFA